MEFVSHLDIRLRSFGGRRLQSRRTDQPLFHFGEFRSSFTHLRGENYFVVRPLRENRPVVDNRSAHKAKCAQTHSSTNATTTAPYIATTTTAVSLSQNSSTVIISSTPETLENIHPIFILSSKNIFRSVSSSSSRIHSNSLDFLLSTGGRRRNRDDKENKGAIFIIKNKGYFKDKGGRESAVAPSCGKRSVISFFPSSSSSSPNSSIMASSHFPILPVGDARCR